MKKTQQYNIWIRWLGDVIERETAKPDGEADMALVRECERALCDLIAERDGTLISDAAMEARLTAIKTMGYAAPRTTNKAGRISRAGKLAACIALAAVVGIGGALASLSALAARQDEQGTVPPVSQTTSSAESVTQEPPITWEGIRYTSLTETADYDDLETLLAEQALEIPYPTVLPEGVTVTAVSVDVTANPAIVTFGFSEPSLTMAVALNTTAGAAEATQSGERYAVDGMVSYLRQTESGYRATVIGAGTVAVVEAISRETLTTVLDGIAQSTPHDPQWTTMTVHDGYLYYTEYIYASRTYEVIRRMNLATGEISTACEVEGCEHKKDVCPFFCGNTRGFMIFGDWMLVKERKYGDKANISNVSAHDSQFVYNLKTKEVRQLPAILRDSFKSIRMGNCLYLVKHGNKLTYSDGVTRTYCKVYEYNLNTAEYRVVYEHNDLIGLLYGSNTRIYFFRETATATSVETAYCSFNPETGKMQQEPTITLLSPDAIYQNRLYRIEPDSETYTRRILVNDVSTGARTQIAPEGLIAFSVAEKGLYYLRMDEYTAYLEAFRRRSEQYDAELNALAADDFTARSTLYDAYERDRERLVAQYLLPYDAEIWYCDLTGGNPVKKYEIPFVLTGATMYIQNDTMYTFVNPIDPETGASLAPEGNYLPAAIDLTNGKMTLLTTQE